MVAEARCLDLTRLVSRAGQGPPTGVDRVEFAYLQALLGRPEPVFALCRTAVGFTLLDRDGMLALRGRITGAREWGAPDLAARLSRRLSPVRARAEADLRRLALDNCLRPGLARMLRRHLPAGTRYFNTGHSNLTEPVMLALRKVANLRIAVLVHDTIPLDFPQFQRPGTPQVFARKMRVAARHADLVICNSDQTARDVQRQFTVLGRVPPTLTARLAIDPPSPDPGTIVPSRPYFVTVGTIEPRKNHVLLLDIWDHFAATLPPTSVPDLLILGRRGWNNDAVFARLDRAPQGVREIADLPDGAVAAFVQNARALLFPSLAEGFGLPPLEAAALGTPVICAPLPVYREFLGNYPVYASVTDMYEWAAIILKHATIDNGRHDDGAGQQATPVIRPWDDHFNLVFTTF